MKRVLFFIFIMFFIVTANTLEAQYFGKNKVQYEDFDWQYLQSEHFDIYFTDGGFYIAEFVAEIAEVSYKKLKADFRFELIGRLTILTYNSHNDFEQTNVSLGAPEETVGGFTEFFKNRVVIPYEGDWEKFRHVIHHEVTHAVMVQMLYGAGVQSIITGMARLRVPLWWIEGLAEYESRHWDTESDMFMRDASLNGYVPPVDYLYGFMAYKGGQSVLYYLSQKYGNEKIGEILGKIKVTKSMTKGLKESIGIDTKELTKKWHMYLKREYWPDIADRQEPEEIGKRMTDHRKEKSFVNSGPALSPKGDKLVFISDRSDYFDVYLMSAIDGKMLGKLVSGQRSGNLEELHWLRAGLSWAPDGKNIVFAAKAGEQDALHIVDIKKKDIIKSIKMDIDGVFSPAWSPSGDEIAFMGIQNGQGDIYSYNIKTKSLKQITNDIYSDLEPAWSPDGEQLTFISDRGCKVVTSNIISNYDIYNKNFNNYDVYIIDKDGNEIKRITKTSAMEESPVFSPKGDMLAYTSDRSGINNIYLYDLETNNEYPITNVLTGIFHLSWEGESADRLAFASFYNAGYDVYLLKNPLKIKADEIELKETNFVAKNKENAFRDSTFYTFKEPALDESEKEEKKYANFIFGDEFKKGSITVKKQDDTVFLDSTEYKDANGEYRTKNYRVKFSPDVVQGNANYSQFFGLQGATQLAFSDVLGNHRINLFTNLFYDLRNSNFQTTYYYLPHQMDYGIGGFHYVYFFYTRGEWVRDRYYGASWIMSYPFSRYSRVDFGARWFGINRSLVQYSIDLEKRRNIFLDLSLINDTVVWSYTGPANGSRSSLSFTYSPKYNKDGLDFFTLKGDWRRYIRVKRDYNFVLRTAAGLSDGKQPRKFFLGGTSGWLNYSTRYGGLKVDKMEDIYFSSFELPLRGASYYELEGNRFALVNLEFRFPFIHYFIMGFPLPIGLQNIRGVFFTDIGSAWYYTDFKGAHSKGGALPQLNDIYMGYGFGARLNLGIFVLRFDAAWNTDLVTTSPKPKYYFSLGPEF